MKIFCYDDDPRLKSEGLEAYSRNSGSFAVVTNGLNKELAKLGLLGTEEDADIVGFASGLGWDFGFKDRKRFLINVWETNILPERLLRERYVLEGDNYQVFGLSEQISQVWRDYDFPTETVDIGCDTDFWAPQDIKRNSKFTILCTASCNFRSGIYDLLYSFSLAYLKDKDMRLIIKNTDERARRLPQLIKTMQERGYDVEYICERQDVYQVRELMAKCHLMSYPVINTSAGLPILESGAMELPVIVNDFCPVNLYPVCEKVKVEPKTIAEMKHTLIEHGGLPYTFPEGWIDETKAFVYWPNFEDFSEKILKIKNSYDIYSQRAKDCRKEVIKRWTWAHSCQQLLNNLK